MMLPIAMSRLLSAPDAEVRTFAELLRAQFDGEGCTCDPNVLLLADGHLNVGHDDDCSMCNAGKTLFRTTELRKRPS